MVSLEITSIGNYPVILALPWLSQHNPVADWIHQSIVFSSQYCLTQCIKSDKLEEGNFVPTLIGNLPSKTASGTPYPAKGRPMSLSSPVRPMSLSSPARPMCLPSPELPCSLQSPPVPALPKISLVSAATFRSAIKKAAVYGITSTKEVSSYINPLPDEDDDISTLNQASVTTLVPPEFHHYLEVFNKSNSDKLPDHGPYDHQIPLEGNAQPKFGPIYSLSEVELKAWDEHLKDNLKKEFIQPSTSTAGSPILFVKKADGTLRLCVDYRQLNSITRKNQYSLPLIQESLDRLKEATWFSKIDLRTAYNLIRIAKGDAWKTAFRTRYGHYRYQVMPFELSNAPASYQNLINNTLRDFLDIFVIVYLDDILIYSKTREEHVNHVNQVLQRLLVNKLWAKAEKCSFFQHQVDFLSYLVSDKGITMDPKRLKLSPTGLCQNPSTISKSSSVLPTSTGNSSSLTPK